jgi:hypothetical protein
MFGRCNGKEHDVIEFLGEENRILKVQCRAGASGSMPTNGAGAPAARQSARLVSRHPFPSD